MLRGSLTIGLFGLVEPQPGAIVVFLPLVREKFDRSLLRLDRRVEVAGFACAAASVSRMMGFFHLVNSQPRVANWTAVLPSRNFASGQAAMSIALALYDLGSPGSSRMASANRALAASKFSRREKTKPRL